MGYVPNARATMRALGQFTLLIVAASTGLPGAEATADGPAIPIKAVHVASYSDHTLVLVSSGREVRHETGRLSGPPRVYVDLIGACLSPELNSRAITVDDQFLKRIRISEPDRGVIRLEFYLNAAVVERVMPSRKTPGLLVDLQKAASVEPKTTVVSVRKPAAPDNPADPSRATSAPPAAAAQPVSDAGGAQDFARSGGQGVLAFQGYYEGRDSAPFSHISGSALSFRHFVAGIGVVSGNFETYGRRNGFQYGDNHLELRGLPWLGQRWTFTGGDFRAPSTLVDIPFYNFYYPELNVRGAKVESFRKHRRYGLFFGNETLLEGPRVPFRVRAPQSVLGAFFQQKDETRYQLGVRFLRLWNSPDSLGEGFLISPVSRDFRAFKSLAVQASITPSRYLKLFTEGEASSARREGTPSQPGSVPFSGIAGAVWVSGPLTARANYASQGSFYLPLAGYFLGDRRGPFAELRYRPARFVEFFGSAGSYSNNLERDARRPTFHSDSNSAGASVTLPYRFNLTGQLTSIRFSSTPGAADLGRESDHRQIVASLAKPIGRHNLRLSLQEMRMATNTTREHQTSRELEDSIQFKRFAVGGAARLQRTSSDQSRSTIFIRGFAQASFGRFRAYANIESGNDLANRSVFATNTLSTTFAGVNTRMWRSWNVQAEVFRTRLNSELNPESIFLLQTRGVGLQTTLASLNQWSLFFRITRQLRWGAPQPGEGLNSLDGSPVLLGGSIEGFVWDRTETPAAPVEGVSVSLDESRVTSTDSAGRFRFLEVGEGPHIVGLTASRLPAEYDPGPHSQAGVRVEPRRSVRVELDVIRLMSVTGKVAGPTGVALEGILIHLTPSGKYTSTDADGGFSFHNLRQGEYSISVNERTLPENTFLKSAEPFRIALTQGMPGEPVHFELLSRKFEKPLRKTTLTK